MNFKITSFKVMFIALVFFIVSLFIVLNLFMYDLYKRDILLILNKYREIMPYNHGEVSRFYVENLSELYFLKENMREKGGKIHINDYSPLIKSGVYGDNLKKNPYTLIAEKGFINDNETIEEIESLLRAFDILELKNIQMNNRYIYISNNNFIFIYPQNYINSKEIKYLKETFYKHFTQTKYQMYPEEISIIKSIDLSKNISQDKIYHTVYTKLFSNNKFRGNLYSDVLLSQLDNYIIKELHSTDYMFFSKEKELFYSNGFKISKKEKINDFLKKTYNKTLEQMLNNKNTGYKVLLFESNNITYLKIIDKDAFIERKKHILSISLKINSLILLISLCFVLIIAQLIKKDVKAINLIDYQNTVDDLTKLFNRKTILKLLSENFYNPNIYIALIDIDKFKTINDTYGHPFGDFVLIKISKLLKVIVGDKGYVARYGGEEFIVIFIGKDYDTVTTVCERINRIIYEKGKYIIGKQVSVSIGYTKKEDDIDYSTVIERADKNLYEAKNTGRNKVVYK